MTQPIKIDFGCGPRKFGPEWIGVDAIKFDGVDVVMDITQTPWPWEDNSVAECYSSHFVEHLSREQWVPFFNECYRIMDFGAQLRVITPHWAHDCSYGDPTHKSFLSPWVGHYLNKGWRDVNAPHCGYTCDFDFQFGWSWDEWLSNKSDDYRNFAINYWRNSYRDLHLIMTKTKRT